MLNCPKFNVSDEGFRPSSPSNLIIDNLSVIVSNNAWLSGIHTVSIHSIKFSQNKYIKKIECIWWNINTFFML